ncbi:hypothetical protein CAPTEDRAFT_227786 [Capitella teleta]|uniref:Zinc finger CHCC-type domain-containing protein n=1 Tax=Capitella teleta TaxID=283909 RepID=R7VCL8_CAPTE|nr:hypothetical protein CAPTEDRAFT_227786 [Capitella teleta]|eukprot:ELU16374.1 hypothetical protein CAPTEDRAFT_227786 [Capitella teleta]
MALMQSGRSLFQALGRCQVAALSRGAHIFHMGDSPNIEKTTHTGQKFDEDDYRKARFLNKSKHVNPNFAVDLIAEDPVVLCTKRVVPSNSGGALGHPKVYINLDKPGIHSCGYSGRKFVLQKYYDEATMGPSITFEEYQRQMQA